MNKPVIKTIDKYIVITLAVAALACSFVLGRFVPDGILRGNSDFWFQGDVNRVVNNMVSRDTNHGRAKVHPLFSLSTYPVVTAASSITRQPPLAVASGMIMMTAAIWVALIFLICRYAGLSTSQSVLITLCGSVSSTALFWFGNVETYPFGSVSVLFALLLAAKSVHRKPSTSVFVISGILTFAYTITNFWASVASAVSVYPIKKAAQILAASLVLGLALFAVQKALFPSAGVPMDVRGEQAFIRSLSPVPVYEATRTFLAHSAVAPDIKTLEIETGTILAFQHTGLFERTAIASAALVAWLVLLAAGVTTIIRKKEKSPLVTATVIYLLGQYALHVVYGEETFLYALHYFPALLIIGAYGFKGKLAPVAAVATAVFIVCGSIANANMLSEAVEIAKSLPVIP